MKRNSKYIILICSFILISSLWALNADFLESSRFLPEFELEAPAPQEPDTIPPRFPVSKTTTEEYEDLLKKSPADLKDPEYCPDQTGRYGTGYSHDVNTRRVSRL